MSMVAGLMLIVAGAAAPVPRGTAAHSLMLASSLSAPRPEPARHAQQNRWRLPQLSQPLSREPAPTFKWRGPIVEFRMPLPMTR